MCLPYFFRNAFPPEKRQFSVPIAAVFLLILYEAENWGRDVNSCSFLSFVNADLQCLVMYLLTALVVVLFPLSRSLKNNVLFACFYHV